MALETLEIQEEKIDKNHDYSTLQNNPKKQVINPILPTRLMGYIDFGHGENSDLEDIRNGLIVDEYTKEGILNKTIPLDKRLEQVENWFLKDNHCSVIIYKDIGGSKNNNPNFVPQSTLSIFYNNYPTLDLIGQEEQARLLNMMDVQNKFEKSVYQHCKSDNIPKYLNDKELRIAEIGRFGSSGNFKNVSAIAVWLFRKLEDLKISNVLIGCSSGHAGIYNKSFNFSELPFSGDIDGEHFFYKQNVPTLNGKDLEILLATPVTMSQSLIMKKYSASICQNSKGPYCKPLFGSL